MYIARETDIFHNDKEATTTVKCNNLNLCVPTKISSKYIKQTSDKTLKEKIDTFTLE